MTIAHEASSALFTQSGDNSPRTLTWPATDPGDKAILLITSGSPTPGEGAVTTPAGWNALAAVFGGTGAFAFQNGARRSSAFEYDCDGSETGTFDVSWASSGGGAIFGARIEIFSKTESEWAETESGSGVDATANSAFTITTGSAVSLQPGDAVVGLLSGSVENVMDTPAFAATGVTFDTATGLESSTVSGGNQAFYFSAWALVDTGTEDEAVTFSGNVVADGMGGSGVVVRLRESSGGGDVPIAALAKNANQLIEA